MFGHLPVRYQATIWVTGLVLFGALGAWLATSTSVPIVWRAGGVLGVAVGALLVSAFSHLLAEPRHVAPRHVAPRHVSRRHSGRRH
jgi:hypothetical protein